MQRQTLVSIVFGLLCGLLAAGGLYLTTRPPGGSPVSLLPPPEPAPIVVHISGAVAQPGLYSLPVGSRVQDLIAAAGGLLPEADDTALNLAAPLEDGTHLVIPSRKPTLPPPPTARPGAAATPVAGPTPPPGEEVPASSGAININTATLEELDTLPGVGPAIAQRIIDYRTTNGLFVTIEDLQNVKGIGPATFEKLKALITVGP
jgi:competence protein ComEA